MIPNRLGVVFFLAVWLCGPAIPARGSRAGDGDNGSHRPTTSSVSLQRALELNEQAHLDHSEGRYARAERRYLEALGILEELDASDTDKAILHLNLGIHYRTLERFEKATEHLSKSIRLQESAVAFSVLAQVYRDTGGYAEARDCLARAIEATETAGKQGASDRAAFANRLATLHAREGDQAEAERTLLDSIGQHEDVLGDRDPLILSAYVLLAVVQTNMGNLVEAERTIDERFPLVQQSLGMEHPVSLAALVAEAAYLSARGDYSRAIEAQSRALVIQEKVEGADHTGHARMAIQLATLKAERVIQDVGVEHGVDELESARSLLDHALRFYDSSPRRDELAVSDALYAYALIELHQGEYDRAMERLGRVVEIRDAGLPPRHAKRLSAIALAGVVALHQGDCQAAVEYHRQGLAGLDGTGANARSSSEFHLGAAVSYLCLDDVTSAADHLQRSGDLWERWLVQALWTGTGAQKQAIMDMTAQSLDVAVSLHLTWAAGDQEIAALALENVLRHKSRLLDAQADVHRLTRRSLDPETAAILDDLRNLHAHRANLSTASRAATSGSGGIGKDLDADIDRLQQQLMAGSWRLREQTRPVTPAMVADALPGNAALVEYVRFLPVFGADEEVEQRDDSEPRYAAYVLRPSGSIAWADLGPASVIEDRVQRFRQDLALQRGVGDTGEELHRLLLEPLTTWVDDVEHWIVSPDGQLNLLSFDALPTTSGRYLAEEHTITYVTTGREVLGVERTGAVDGPVVVVADPDYDAVIGPLSEGGGAAAAKGQERWLPLPGTSQEAHAISSLFAEVDLLTGRDATESVVRALEGPPILHVATHGFFSPDSSQRRRSSTSWGATTRGLVVVPEGASPVRGSPENPLLRSGLVLAGANSPAPSGDDGYMSAYEVVDLDLVDTQLVVLSACETGRGDVRAGQGVFGLRRALELAGAESLVLSLWEVDDEATRVLMVAFYSNLARGVDLGQALREAKMSLRLSDDWSHPYYWAAFVPSGDWGPVEGIWQ